MLRARPSLHLTSRMLAASLSIGCGEEMMGPGLDASFRPDLSVGFDAGPTPGLSAEMQALLDVMNEARAETNSAPLVWNAEVATTASSWAMQCRWEHAPQNDRIFVGELLGENLAAGSGLSWTPAALGRGWNEEKAFYDCPNDECQAGETCGHYTQVIWRSSTAVGCAIHDCQSGSPFGGPAWRILVCRYLPAGNFVGLRPIPVSDCP